MANLEPDSTAGKRTKFGGIPTVSQIRRETARPAAEKDWKEIQNSTFMNWSNYIIGSSEGSDESKVNDLLMDFSNGVNLVELVNHLAQPRGIKDYVKNPKTEFQKLDNLYKALNFIQKDEGIKLVGIGADDLKDGREKPIMGLIWTLIKHYKIKKGGKQGGKEGVSERQSLLKWVNVIIEPEHVGNLKTDWNSGVAVCGLVEGLSPGTIAMGEINPDEGYENCDLGISRANDLLGVPKLIAPEDMNNPKVDELSMMTYLSGYIAPFDREMLNWVNSKLPDNQVDNLSGEWNSGEKLTALLNAHVPGFYPPFAEDDEESYQGLLNKIEQEYPSDYEMNAKRLKDPSVDSLSVGCYLYKLKKHLDLVPVEDPDLTRRKEELTLWVNDKIPHNKASNYSSDWNDGRRLRDLMNAHIPGFYAGFDYEDNSGGTYQQLLDKIDTRLNYPCPLSADQLSDPKVDETVVVAYLEGLRERLRDYEISEQERIQRERLAAEALARREREERQRLYERQKGDLMQWVNEMVWPNMSVSNFESDWRNSEAISALLNSIRPGTVVRSDVEGNNREKWDRAIAGAENNFRLKANFTGGDATRDLEERECVAYVSMLLEPFNQELLQWVNSKLPATQLTKNFGDNWQDGKRLASLIEVTAPGFLPKGFEPSDSQQGQEVLARLHRDLGNRCPYSYQDIISGNYEPAIFAAYINRFRDTKQPYQSDELLRWVNCMIAPKQVANLTTSWSDGEALTLLVDAVAEREADSGQGLSSRDDVCRDAVDDGESLLDVHTRNFTAHELAVGNVDEFRMRQYLSDYRDVFMKNNYTTAGAARGGVENAMEERGIRLTEEEISALPTNNETAKNRALINAAAEKYMFNFPSDDDTLRNLDEDIHVTTAFLYHLKSAPERPSKLDTPQVSPVSSLQMEVAPFPARMDAEKGSPVENTKLIKPKDRSISKRKKIQCCIVTIVIISGLLIIAILVGAFVGLAVGVWNV